MNEECISCEWYNKPYWSITSPCTNCRKRFNKKSATVTQYSINIDNKELYKQIEQLQQENQKYKEVIDKIQKHCEIEINASNHYLENHSSQQELCHKVAHQRILDMLKEVE